MTQAPIAFKPVTLCDKSWVDEIVRAENSPSADYNFGNIYIWDKFYRQLIARAGGRMLTKLRYEGQPAFVFPIGSGPLRPAVELLRQYAAWRDYPLVIRGITDRHRELLEREYPGCFSYVLEEKNLDYIYRAEKLATYAGKSLHGKKNHCNRFEAEHDWDFLPLSRELIPGCLDMLDVWTEENSERLGLEGGVLRAEGKIVGFSLGEMCAEDTFDVHFEKAQIDLNGAYPMVCRELTRMLLKRHPGLQFLNREDDMGFASLRQSKLSYKPEYLLNKFIARWNDG